MRFVSKNEGISESLTAGRVEIFFAGRWGTICSDNFTLMDAMGLCSILTGSSDVLAFGTIDRTSQSAVSYSMSLFKLINLIHSLSAIQV